MSIKGPGRLRIAIQELIAEKRTTLPAMTVTSSPFSARRKP